MRQHSGAPEPKWNRQITRRIFPKNRLGTRLPSCKVFVKYSTDSTLRTYRKYNNLFSCNNNRILYPVSPGEHL